MDKLFTFTYCGLNDTDKIIADTVYLFAKNLGSWTQLQSLAFMSSSGFMGLTGYDLILSGKIIFS